MKLRTTHNSIRIRVRKSEIAALQNFRTVEESIRFPTGLEFKFALKISAEVGGLSADVKDNYLVLLLPENEAKKWINTNQIGMETNIKLAGGDQLHLLVEKDFPCLDRPEEDKSDTFWELAPNTPEAC